MGLRETVQGQLDKTLGATDFKVGKAYHGKVRDNYTVGDKRLIVVTDRISAFDWVLGTVPFKGQVLNQMAAHWFELAGDLAPSHLISIPDPTAALVKECVPLKAEFVMRSYLTGSTSTSIWRAYESGKREFCGHQLPDGMKKNEPLAHAILTPSTKAEKGDHDESVSKDELLRRGAVTPEEFEIAETMVKRLFAFGQQEAAKQGLILVDTKYELGTTTDGEVVFIDEIHTPDSSRYWYREDYEERLSRGEAPRSLDKEFVRRWYVSEHNYRGEGPPPELNDEIRVEAAMRYMEIFSLVTGRTFEPDASEPLERLNRVIGELL